MKSLVSSIFLLAGCRLYGQSNVVTDWAAIVQPAIHNAGAPRPPASAEVLHTIVQLAIYDAVIAIEGGYRPYAAEIQAPAARDVRAAVATAAYRTARARVLASQVAYLDGVYTSYMAGIPGGPAKTGGIQVGESAAAAILAARANDGFQNVVPYVCTSDPPPVGEFEPNAGCGTQPVDTNLGQVKPFTFNDPSQFRSDGPPPMNSNTYTEDFREARDYGRSNSTLRTAEQTDIAYFWSEHTYVHWNRNLINLAINRRLSARDTARFLALVHTAAADALIAGFEAKYFYRYWRPRTAIPQAGDDGNPDTVPDPSWIPLLTVNHPEYPSAHGFWSTAVTDSIARFFGTNKVIWMIATSKAAVPQVVQTERTYHNLNALMREVDDARVWAGLHWRHSMRHGAQIGRKVAQHVSNNFFRPALPGAPLGVRLTIRSVHMTRGIDGLAAHVSITNEGSEPAAGVYVTSAVLGSSAPATSALTSLGTLAPGASENVQLVFPASAGSAGAASVLRVDGVFGGGTFGGGLHVTIP